MAKILVSGVALEENDLTKKILTPQSRDEQIISSVDYRGQNGVSSFSKPARFALQGPLCETFGCCAHFLQTNFCKFWLNNWS